MTSPAHDIERLEPHERRAAQDALTESFVHELPYSTILTRHHREAVHHLMGFIINSTMENGHVNITRDPSGRIDGVAAWVAPGRAPLPWYRELPGLVPFLRCVKEAGPADIRTLFQFSAELDRRHPTEPHWYLFSLGVRADRQGRGQGRALLEHQLAVADTEGIPCYLDTQKPSNVGYYERFGFAENSPPASVAGLTVWYLLRPSPNKRS